MADQFGLVHENNLKFNANICWQYDEVIASSKFFFSKSSHSTEEAEKTEFDFNLSSGISSSFVKMSAAGTQNQKPDNSDSRIALRFKLNLGEGEDHVLLTIKRDTKLQKAIDHLCNKRSLDGKTLRFLYNGNQFAKNKTPEQLGMKKGDEIDVMMECGGGGGSRAIES